MEINRGERDLFYFSLHFTTESSSDVFIFSSSTVHTALVSARHSQQCTQSATQLTTTAHQRGAVQVEAAVAFTTVTAAVPDILPGKMTN